MYKRILLKLSGEALSGDRGTGFDEETCVSVAGVETAFVIGGGNFWRGRSSGNMDRTKADQIGMLATVMNCMYMSEMCRSVGLSTQILTPFACGAFTELFSKDRVNRYLSEGTVVFLAGGTGHPYFSTDTATALRAVEIEADIILAARAVDGVYDSDPAVNPKAKKYDTLPMSEVVDRKLGVMDLSAAVLCMENKMPMYVFDLNKENSIVDAVNNNSSGTAITVDQGGI